MPYIYVEPDLFLEHNGIEVYPLYDASGCESQYWYTLNPNNADEFYGHGNNGQFDARLLAALWETTPSVKQWDDFWRPRFASEEDAIRALIERAIERGTVAQAGEARRAETALAGSVHEHAVATNGSDAP